MAGSSKVDFKSYENMHRLLCSLIAINPGMRIDFKGETRYLHFLLSVLRVSLLAPTCPGASESESEVAILNFLWPFRDFS